MPKARRFTKTFFPNADGVIYELHHGKPREEVVVSLHYCDTATKGGIYLSWVSGDEVITRDASSIIDAMYTYRGDGGARARHVWSLILEEYKELRKLNKTK